MRDGRDEVRLHLVDFTVASHVLERDRQPDRSAAALRRRLGNPAQHALEPRQRQVSLSAPGVAEERPQRQGQPVLGTCLRDPILEQIEEVAADHGVGVGPEQVSGLAIDGLDAALLRDEHDAVGGRIEDPAKTLPLRRGLRVELGVLVLPLARLRVEPRVAHDGAL